MKARALVKDRVPISVIPRVPFPHLYMDIIGPLFKYGEYKYCLCLVDSHTRHPFAYPLRSATAKAVCECLIDVLLGSGFHPKLPQTKESIHFTTKLCLNMSKNNKTRKRCNSECIAT